MTHMLHLLNGDSGEVSKYIRRDVPSIQPLKSGCYGKFYEMGINMTFYDVRKSLEERR